MSEPTRKPTSLWRRVVAFQDWRRSETILLSGVFFIGVVILTIHLATWGREVRRESKSLQETTCEVLALTARPMTAEDGTTWYRPEVKIRYSLYGETYDVYTWSRATLTDDQGFVYTKEEAESVLAGYKVGQETVCWVRSDNPSCAFLVKEPTYWGWIFLIIPVSLMLFGGALLVVRLTQRLSSKEALASLKRQETQYPTVPSFEGDVGVALAKRLPSDVKSSFAFTASAFGTCVWNLASWAALVYVLYSSETTADYWYAGIFGAIFCGVGFLFACRLWGQYRVERVVGSTALEASTVQVIPGRKVKLCLVLKGRIQAKRLEAFVKCEEVARFVQGTNSICNRHEVFSRSIYNKYDVDVPSGSEERESFQMILPQGVAHSFVAEHNEIEWKIVVRLEFADGGTFTRDFAFVVMPFLGGKYSGR